MPAPSHCTTTGVIALPQHKEKAVMHEYPCAVVAYRLYFTICFPLWLRDMLLYSSHSTEPCVCGAKRRLYDYMVQYNHCHLLLFGITEDPWGFFKSNFMNLFQHIGIMSNSSGAKSQKMTHKLSPWLLHSTHIHLSRQT